MQYSPLIRLSLAGAIVLAPVARAQGPTRLSGAIDLGALVQREGVDLWQSATRLAPSVRLDQRFMRMSLDGSIVGSGQSVMLNHGTLDAALSPAPIGPLRLSVGGRAERLASSLYSPRTVLTVESSLSLTAGVGGAWLGAAMERSPQVDSMGAQPLLRAGLWRQIGGAVITVSTSSRAARLGGKAATTRTEYYPDSVFVNTDTAKGWNHFQRSRTFGDSAQASRTKLWSEVAFIASAGNDPARITIGTPQTRVATLGLRLSRLALLRPPRALPVRPTAAAFSLRAVGANTYVVSIRVPRARTVELSGDFGRWKPLALYETSPDVWETTLTLPPGTYRMNLRVDGDQWKAPPGMAEVADEFNGTVGIIAVR